MLDEALTALAATGGTAVIQAAGTTAWQEFQQSLARWFGRGDEERERTVLERLDHDADALAAVGETGDVGEIERVRIGQQAAWQTRFEAVLESLHGDEREQAAQFLRTLLAAYSSADRISAGDGGQAVGGNVEIRADHGSAAALRMGDVALHNPPQPGPQQG